MRARRGVQRIVVDAGFSTEVRGALCFVGTRLPWVSEAVAGIALVDELGLFSMLQAQGPVAADERRG